MNAFDLLSEAAVRGVQDGFDRWFGRGAYQSLEIANMAVHGVQDAFDMWFERGAYEAPVIDLRRFRERDAKGRYLPKDAA